MKNVYQAVLYFMAFHRIDCEYELFYHISQNRLGIGYTKHVPIFKAGNYDYLLTHPRELFTESFKLIMSSFSNLKSKQFL